MQYCRNIECLVSIGLLEEDTTTTNQSRFTVSCSSKGVLHYQQQKLNFNSDGLKPYFSTDFDAFYFSHFVTRWRYFRSSIYCQIRRVARLAFVCL